MRRELGPFVLVLLTAAGSAHAGDRVDFRYTVGSEAAHAAEGFAPGFDLSGEALRVDLRRPSHLYLLTEATDGTFLLAWPDVRGVHKDGASLPRTTLLRLDQGGTDSRTWIVVSATGVPELDALVHARRSVVPEALARGLRERYPVVGLFERDAKQNGASIKLATRDGSRAVVIEEIER